MAVSLRAEPSGWLMDAGPATTAGAVSTDKRGFIIEAMMFRV